MSLLRQFVQWLAPLACADCDEGSGLRYDSETGVASVCGTCGGSGKCERDIRAAADAPALIRDLQEAAARRRRRHAA
jgi:hypothetical protein